MKIDGVTVEPSLADDPDSMGHTALDIDCDLDALALKVRRELYRDQCITYQCNPQLPQLSNGCRLHGTAACDRESASRAV